MAAKETATIVDLVEGLPRLRVYDEEISAFEDKFFKSSLPIVDKNTYIGIEVETENVSYWNDTYSPYWKITEDGSLRNNGREFISIPIKAFRVENALTTLFEKQLNKDIDFSERTSIHIHMNVRTMTVEQLKTMILLYLVFEKAMFRYVNPDRYDNIFCVPLNETSFGGNLRSLFEEDYIHSMSWLKYTAMNLCPIFEKGTVEFRHLHGTKDIPEIVNWVNLILCLKKTALKNSSKYLWDKVETLNTSSQYHEFANEVFGEYLTHLDESKIIEDMSSCVTYVKTFCLRNEFLNSLFNRVSEKSPLFKYSRSKPPLGNFFDNLTIPAPTGVWLDSNTDEFIPQFNDEDDFPEEAVEIDSRLTGRWTTAIGATPFTTDIPRPEQVQGINSFSPPTFNEQELANIRNSIQQARVVLANNRQGVRPTPAISTFSRGL